MIDRSDFIAGKGEVTFEKDFLSVYLQYFLDHFKSFRPIKAVVDCGNAAASLIAPEILEKLGCEVIPLYCEPDGRFPNHHPDPTIPENLVDLIADVQTVRSCQTATELDPEFTPEGYCAPNHTHLSAGSLAMLRARPRMSEILRILPGSSLVVAHLRKLSCVSVILTKSH